MEVFPVMTPGLMVQLPAGKPVNITLPVARVQVGCNMVPTIGAICLLTVTVRVAVVAHWPPSGVKVYSVVVVLSKAGAQVPIMPFSDVTGKVMAGAPLQIAAIGSKVGVTLPEFIVTVKVAVVAH